MRSSCVESRPSIPAVSPRHDDSASRPYHSPQGFNFFPLQSANCASCFLSLTNLSTQEGCALPVKCALSYYIQRTTTFSTTQRLFVTFAGPSIGAPASSQTISRWIVQSIHLAYNLAEIPLPGPVRAHSTRAVASSTAFLCGVDIADICRAATWATPSTFVSHYHLDIWSKAEAAVGQAVLASALL